MEVKKFGAMTIRQFKSGAHKPMYWNQRCGKFRCVSITQCAAYL